jgi:Zn-dependent oligopeptidase
MSSPDYQAVQREMAPRLAAFNDQITQNELLFKRIETVYNSPAKAKLTPEQQRLTWLYYTNFVRAGARLNPEAKETSFRDQPAAPAGAVHKFQPPKRARRRRPINSSF